MNRANDACGELPPNEEQFVSPLQEAVSQGGQQPPASHVCFTGDDEYQKQTSLIMSSSVSTGSFTVFRL